jgi:MFS family permease
VASSSHPPGFRRLMVFFAIVYAVEGIGQAKSGIIWQPLTHFLKESMGWTATQISTSLAALDIPWVIKPLYGLVSDFVPLLGYRRRSYLLLANLLAVGAFLWVAQETSTQETITNAIIGALTLTAIAMAISSTLCGALLVENGQALNASAAFVNQQWLWFNIATMAASLLGGYLIALFSPLGALRAAAWIAAIAPIAVLVCLTLVHEAPSRLGRVDLARRLSGLAAVFRSRALLMTAAFLFCYYFSPGFGTPLYFHMSDELGFSQEFIGLLSSISAAGWIAGGVLYRVGLERMPTRMLLRLSILLGVASTLSYLMMHGSVSAMIVYFCSGVSGMVANLATLTLAADNCPADAEGFAFAGLMSIINLATPASDITGSFLYEHIFNHWLAPLIVVSAAATAVMLPLTRMVTLETLGGSGSRAA